MRRVLVVSVRQFHRLAASAVVVPELLLPIDQVAPPWRVEIDGSVFAVDMLESVSIDRLVERVGRCQPSVIDNVRRVLQHIA